MRCLNCNQVTEGEHLYCPICGVKMTKDEENIPIIVEEDKRKEFIDAINNAASVDEIDNDDLPELKDESSEEINEENKNEIKEIDDISLEKTRIFNMQDDDLSLTGLIDKQINDINNEEDLDKTRIYPVTDKIVNENHEDKENDEPVGELDSYSSDENDNDEFNSNESVTKRKKTLIIALIFTILIIIGGFTALYFFENNSQQEARTKLNSSNVEKIFNNYINSNDDKELKELLTDIRDNNEELIKTQKNMNSLLNNYIKKIEDTEYSSINLLTEDINKGKKLLSDIYDITETNNIGTIRLVSNNDFKDLNSYLETVLNNAKPYYEALSYYKDKSYNEAYVMFDKVTNDNNYYDKANSYKRTIVEDVLKSIKNDIIKMDVDIDSLNDDDKLIKYSQIEDVIIAYDNLYPDLKLDNNNEYNTLLNKYRDLVKGLSN